jgi:hypothetical protein
MGPFVSFLNFKASMQLKKLSHAEIIFLKFAFCKVAKSLCLLLSLNLVPDNFSFFRTLGYSAFFKIVITGMQKFHAIT